MHNVKLACQVTAMAVGFRERAAAEGVRRSSVMNWYVEETLDRSGDRVREAEKARLIHEALASTPAQPGLREQALVRVGGWLVGVGQRLQLSGGCVPMPAMTADATEQR